MSTAPPRYLAAALRRFAQTALARAGLRADMAADVAEVLLEGDLLGKTTHGLALLAPYLRQLEGGKMTRDGEPRVLREGPATFALDAEYRPGPWVVRRAIARALEMARVSGTATATIARSHHIGCLQAYLKPVTDQGRLLLLTCADPATATVAAHGGVKAVSTPNPLAAGLPTEGDPVLLDFSAGSSTNALARRVHEASGQYEHAVFQTAAGAPTRDPGVLFEEPPGTILPAGGHKLGHKGFALGILIEALTCALAGHGRAERPDRWGASVFLLVADPEFFGGLAAFQRETQHFAERCRASGPPGRETVRMPGERALARRREQLALGVELHPSIAPALAPWAAKLDVEFPAPLDVKDG